MLVYSATIDTREYPIASLGEANRLKNEIFDAALSAGQYIDIRSSRSHTSSVLVNGSTAVAFDVREAGEAWETEDDSMSSAGEFDYP